MKTILLIGLGRFGRHIAMKLNELNHQVMVVDKDEARVDAVLPFVTNAQIGDSTSEEFLAAIGVRNFDLCIVIARIIFMIILLWEMTTPSLKLKCPKTG